MNTVAQSFTDHLCSELDSQQDKEPMLARFIAELKTIDCTQVQSLPPLPEPPTVTAHLESTLSAMACGPELANAARSLASAARWNQLFEGEGIEPTLAQGLVAGQLAGQVGLVRSDTIRAGLFLLAPHLHYPLHQHGALELYYVVSGQLTLQYGTTTKPFQVSPGEASVTPSNKVHSLTTHEAPCLVVYAWVGEVESPNWWWVPGANGDWDRVCWERQADAKWIQTRSEPVTQATLEEAGET
ncbi:MAG: cupin domain-containing protein [Alphaproteobacteria bacterium]|nr:cupin domain-containing protein [Alphaproteobacteria bacterium]